MYLNGSQTTNHAAASQSNELNNQEDGEGGGGAKKQREATYPNFECDFAGHVRGEVMQQVARAL